MFLPELGVLLGIAAVLFCMDAAGDIPRPEHPRPDFERDQWLNLNGTWQFEIDNDNTGVQRGLMSGKDLAQQIVVPFCPESTLSGIGHTDFMTRVWYRRLFQVPADWTGKRVLLHFGAVDWEATVYVNGTRIGSHKGGYTPFCFDITEVLQEGSNELVVQVFDDTRSGHQATGKQSHEPQSHGCVYTRTTGIWQTVYLEAVGETYVKDFALTPDLDGKRVLVQVSVAGPNAGRMVRLQAFEGQKLVAEEIVPASWRSTLAVLNIPDPRAWEVAPGDPFLYDLSITVEREGQIVDAVHSYFGLRKVHLEGNRILINNKPVFQRTVLDQGFYPDGIYTAPSDEALRRDIELSMAAGFNGARLHQKVFEPRLLYWADRLGYLLWGEYPSWGVNLSHAPALANVLVEWREVLKRDRNHPSIIGWCPLNETGPDEGAAIAQSLLAITQDVDPTRPFLDTSGYVHLYTDTDVYDCHDYDQNPETFRARYHIFSLTGMEPWNNNLNDPRSAYRGQPFFVSEYGGTGLQIKESGAWSYGGATHSVEEFLARYKGLTDTLLDDPNMFGFCYTQLTDVEQEQNGVYRYDRSPKYDPALLRAINARPAAYETQPPRIRKLNLRTLLDSSRHQPQIWRYTTQTPPDTWMLPDFDDSQWHEGPGGFGTQGTPGAVVGTIWNTPDIWIRRSFEVADPAFELAMLDLHHDEDAEVYVNGKLIASLRHYTTAYVLTDVTEALRGVLRAGRNTIAIHCHQTVGGQYIDAGLKVQ